MVTIREVKETLSLLIKKAKTVSPKGRREIPALKIIGPPGIGKTSIIRQVAKESNSKLVEMDPQDFTNPGDVGGALTVKDGMTFVALRHEYKPLMNIKKGQAGILVINDSNRIADALQNELMSLVQFGKIGRDTLPANVLIVTTDNQESHNMNVRRLDAAQKTRSIKVMVSADFESWIVWAAKNKIDWRIIEYLTSFPDQFLDASTFDPNPRTWEMISRAVSLAAVDKDNLNEKALKVLLDDYPNVMQYIQAAKKNDAINIVDIKRYLTGAQILQSAQSESVADYVARVKAAGKSYAPDVPFVLDESSLAEQHRIFRLAGYMIVNSKSIVPDRIESLFADTTKISPDMRRAYLLFLKNSKYYDLFINSRKLREAIVNELW